MVDWTQALMVKTGPQRSTEYDALVCYSRRASKRRQAPEIMIYPIFLVTTSSFPFFPPIQDMSFHIVTDCSSLLYLKFLHALGSMKRPGEAVTLSYQAFEVTMVIHLMALSIFQGTVAGIELDIPHNSDR